MDRFIRLREALERADSLPHKAALFLPFDRVWSLDTPCAILDVDPHDDSTSIVPLAQENGLSYALSVAQVQDVVHNAGQQVRNPTPEQLLAAFLFYYDRDAFIRLDSDQGD